MSNDTLKALVKKNLAARNKNKIESVTNLDSKSFVNVSVKSDGEEKEVKSERKILSQAVVKDKLGYISYESGGSLNLGDYNNGKFSVSLMVPVGVEITEDYKARIQNAFEFAKKWVDERALSEAKELIRLRRGC